jgi:predicted dehydrogenase
MKTTRRRFLQLAGGSASFNLLPSRVFGKNAPGNRIALGVIGLGGMGMANLESLLTLDEVAVNAVCDVSLAKRRAAQLFADGLTGSRSCEAMGDYRELCARADIDAVVIATPDHSHAAIGVEAARHGKDIYGEPPFTHTLREGRALAGAVAENGRVWQTGSWHRSHSVFQTVASFVRKGGLGPVARIEVGLPGGGRGPVAGSFSVALPPGLDWQAWQEGAEQRPYRGVSDFHWRWVSAWGGGMLASWIGHYGDVALWGAGRDATGPVRVEGSGEFPLNGLFDTATSFSYRCTFSDGLELAVADGGRLEKGVGVRWIGRGGEWVWVTRGAAESSRAEVLREMRGSGCLAGQPSHRAVLAAHHRNFIDCIKTRRPTVAPAEAAHRAASLGHLGQLAMRTGRVIGFDPQTEVIS